MKLKIFMAVCILVVALFSALTSTAASKIASSKLQYLTFQIFVYMSGRKFEAPDFEQKIKAKVEKIVGELLKNLKTTGDAENTQLGIILGPITLNHSDQQIKDLINGGFDIAEKNNIAIGFHFDDNNFWSLRKDLTAVPSNIEWTDWDGNTNARHRVGARKIAWLPLERLGLELAPTMNYASPALKKEVKRIIAMSSEEIKINLSRLEKNGKEHLFAGVLVGWESRLDDDTKPYVQMGYAALTEKGFSKDNPPINFDEELNKITYEWVELWSKSFSDSGISKNKIFTHLPITHEDTHKLIHSPPDNAFNSYSLPGFSVRLKGNTFEEIYELLKKHDSTNWANGEGNNLSMKTSVFSSEGADSPFSHETYLAKHFNHGAVLVNLFGWETPNQFGESVREESAIAAYTKFLKNERLVDAGAIEGLEDSEIVITQENVRAYLKNGGSREIIKKLKLLETYKEQKKIEEAKALYKEIEAMLKDNRSEKSGDVGATKGFDDSAKKITPENVRAYLENGGSRDIIKKLNLRKKYLEGEQFDEAKALQKEIEAMLENKL